MCNGCNLDKVYTDDHAVGLRDVENTWLKIREIEELHSMPFRAETLR